MFEDRKSVFVDLLKWNVPVLDGRFEVDEFDDEHATYIVVAGEDGRASRLGAPASRRSGGISSGRSFRNYARRLPPTRSGDPRDHPLLPVAPAGRARAARDAQPAGQRACVAMRSRPRIKTYTGVAEMAWLQQILAFGWDCRPLGSPRQLDCGLTRRARDRDHAGHARRCSRATASGTTSTSRNERDLPRPPDEERATSLPMPPGLRRRSNDGPSELLEQG